jgi:hypothetical protein
LFVKAFHLRGKGLVRGSFDFRRSPPLKAVAGLIRSLLSESLCLGVLAFQMAAELNARER